MRHRIQAILGGPALLGALLLTTACVEDGTAPQASLEDLRPSESVLRNDVLTQVDRFGLPAVNTAFVADGADKDRFNESVPANDEADFLALLTNVINSRYGIGEAPAAALADFVLPDVQPLGDLSGFPNGRRLQDDVIDTELFLIFGGAFGGPVVDPLLSDNVDGNDVPFLGAFPYLAQPHS